MTPDGATRPSGSGRLGPPDDPEAPPRHNGELVFDAPWQARAFGLVVALLDHHDKDWDAFRPHLVAAIAAAPAAPYYEQLVVALAAFGDELAGEAGAG